MIAAQPICTASPPLWLSQRLGRLDCHLSDISTALAGYAPHRDTRIDYHERGRRCHQLLQVALNNGDLQTAARARVAIAAYTRAAERAALDGDSSVAEAQAVTRRASGCLERLQERVKGWFS